MDRKKILICSKIENYTESKKVMLLLQDYGYDCNLPFFEEYNLLESSKSRYSDAKNTSLLKLRKDSFDIEYNFIQSSDSILILNYDWNNILGYIGYNMYMDIGFAYILGKKIFVLNDLSSNQQNIKRDFTRLGVIYLKGELERIRNYLF